MRWRRLVIDYSKDSGGGGRMRPINADALLKALDLYINRSSLGEITANTEMSIGEICSLIKGQSTVDAEPVKHAHWKNIHGDYSIAQCSSCVSVFDVTYEGNSNEVLWKDLIGIHRYCSYCGAKMDEEKED